MAQEYFFTNELISANTQEILSPKQIKSNTDIRTIPLTKQLPYENIDLTDDLLQVAYNDFISQSIEKQN